MLHELGNVLRYMYTSFVLDRYFNYCNIEQDIRYTKFVTTSRR